MKKFHLNPLVLAMAITALPATVYAQENNDNSGEAVEEVVVTGSFRDSLKNALNVKRNSASAIDSIVAEDIGDFPDNNLADAMQRIPGVNIDRVGGEGRQISVRGLSADFSRVRVNGMETIAAGYGNRTRAFDFNIFASELFSRIDVMKTQSSDVDEGSLGATVDLFTARPLDDDGNVYKVSYTQGFNDRSEDTDPRVTGLVSLQNEAGNLGASFSVAYSERSLVQEGHNSGRWEANSNSGNNRWANMADLPAEVNSAVHPRFPRTLDRGIGLERLGVTGTLQWQIADETSLVFDALHADLNYQQNDRTLTPISLARTGTTGRRQTTVVDYEYDASTNALVYAELDGVDVRSENAFVDADSKFDQYSLAFEHAFTDSLRMKATVGTSESETVVNEESTAIFEIFDVGFTYDYRNSSTNPTLSYDFDPTDVDNWLISEIRDRPAKTSNTYDMGNIELEGDLSEIFTAKIGASWKEFTFDNYGARRDSAIINQNTAPQGSAVSSPASGCLGVDDLAVTESMGSLYTPSNGQNTFFMPNMKSVAEAIGFYDNDTCFPLAPTAGDDRGVTETSTGFYVQLDFDTELAGMRFFGNAGVREVETKQSSDGLVSGEKVTIDRTYNDTLPAVNLNLSPIESVIVRASWAEVMTRPSLGDLTPGGTVDGFNRRYTAGNPNLDPFRAKATDIAAEWYFMDEALLSLAWFEKDIESFPSSIDVTVPWTSLGLPNSLLDNVPATPADDFNYRSKGNGEGGKLDGWELQVQLPITFGPAWMQDFGVKANYTSIDSRVNSGTAEDPVWRRLTGQSDTSYNGTLWYENDSGFQGRISYTYRSDYVNTATSVAGPGSDNTDDVAVVDAAFAYQFNDNLKFTLDLLNLTDEAETLLLSDYDLMDTTLKSGRQYYLGAQYSF